MEATWTGIYCDENALFNNAGFAAGGTADYPTCFDPAGGCPARSGTADYPTCFDPAGGCPARSG